MRLNPMASFAAGILLAASISSAAYFSTKSEASTQESSKKSSITIEEMKTELESSGYIVQTTEEFDQFIENVKASKQKEQPKEAGKTVYRVVINVTDGMTSIDVGNMLVKGKIIEDAFKFTKEVEKRKVENRLRPGSYEVDSEMSQDEIINTIFK
ncbi:aminodeoxychorismate lyase [Siminovitchia sediminis]|uniref:Aminodeoxychorismate lyase n=1 Tax=Siminovitchia sediminis TaxID=1274353 RepID=A0ABW4KFF5_9BACI